MEAYDIFGGLNLPFCRLFTSISVCGVWGCGGWRGVCVYQYVSLSTDMAVCLFVCLSICLSVCLPFCLSACLSVWLTVCLSICLSFYVFIYLFSIRLVLISKSLLLHSHLQSINLSTFLPLSTLLFPFYRFLIVKLCHSRLSLGGISARVIRLFSSRRRLALLWQWTVNTMNELRFGREVTKQL